MVSSKTFNCYRLSFENLKDDDIPHKSVSVLRKSVLQVEKINCQIIYHQMIYHLLEGEVSVPQDLSAVANSKIIRNACSKYHPCGKTLYMVYITEHLISSE